MKCPICSTETTAKRAGTPYWTCSGCGLWFQDPKPPKAYHGPEEPPYGEDDKRANKSLATYLFDDVMRGKAGPTLDVGARYPYLAHCLAQRGCEAHAIDGAPDPHSGLDVTIEIGDFERWEPLRLGYRLITFVHVFEHVYDPLAAIRKLRRLVANDGRVFIRSPDHTIEGIERDLTVHHYLIHPYVHCLSSILELLARAGDAFVVENYWPMKPGQINVVLKPITKRPTIGLGMIVKNEERDLPRLLKSVGDVIDGGVILDTGSTDKTRDVIRKANFKEVTYLAASELIDGDWKLVNFAKARNEFVRRVAAAGFDWLLWMDADDELLTPMALSRLRYMPRLWAFGVWIDLGQGLRQVHYRMWACTNPITFKGWCHEYPELGNSHAPVMQDVHIRHDAAPGIGETSNARNLRILEKQYAAEPDARTAFYLANTHKDGGRPAEAIAWYEKRLGYGDAFRDEYLFALLYLARCFAAIGDETGARNAISYGLELAPDWQEFRLELARAAYRAKDYHEAVKIAKMALDRPQPPTVLWREPGAYSDQPARLISWCYEHVGNFEAAFSWAEVAGQRIGARDDEWMQRTLRLRGQMQAPPAAPAIVKRARQRIALHRPGAIGDILMTLNLLPAFLEANPDADLHYFCAGQYAHEDALGGIIAQAGAVPMDAAGLDAWRKSYDRVIDLVGYPLAEGYPDKPMQLHLLQYFAMELGLSAGFSAPFTGMVDEQTRIVTDIKPDLYQKPWPILPQLALPRPVARWT